MKVGALCHREVITTFEDGSITEAAQLMRDYHVGTIVVVRPAPQGLTPVGIISDRDLVVEILAQDVTVSAVTVADVMSDDPLLATEDDELWETLQRMRQRGVRRIPVVNGERYLVGILAMDDVIDLLADELGQLSGIVPREVAREQALHPAD